MGTYKASMPIRCWTITRTNFCCQNNLTFGTKVDRKTNYLMAQDMLLSLYRDYATQGERKTLSFIDSTLKDVTLCVQREQTETHILTNSRNTFILSISSAFFLLCLEVAQTKQQIVRKKNKKKKQTKKTEK